jgi:hypothetical protein
MAIPHNLIDKIEKGNAQFKTWVFGYGNNGFLPVRDDSYIVIIGFKFWHYLDVFVDELEDLNAVWYNSVKQIKLRSKKSANHFIIRQPIRQIDFPPPQEKVIYDTWGHTEYNDLYLVHEQSVAIDVINSPGDEGVASFLTPNPPRAQNAQQPQGFGTDATPDQVANLQAYAQGGFFGLDTFQYFPHTRELTSDAAAPGFGSPFSVDSLEYPVGDGEGIYITEVGTGRINRYKPLVEFRYIEIDQNPNERIKASR